MEKYYKEDENFNLRLVVIYTGDVKSAESTFETKCLTLRTEQAFLSHIDGAAALILASDKFINREYLDQIRRRINMTQLGQLYEKEKIAYGNQKAKEKTIEMAKSMLDESIDFVKIMKITGLTEAELLRLQDESITV